MAAQGLSVLPITPSSSATIKSCRKPSDQFLSFGSSNSFAGTQLRFHSGGSRPNCFETTPFPCRHRLLQKTGVASEKKAKWSSRAIKSFAMAELEARKLKYPNTGTEALLMGILIEGRSYVSIVQRTSLAANYLRANGITIFKVRDETVMLLGKADLFFFSPEHPRGLSTGQLKRS